ncbi:MAG: hypothetical protein VB144_01980 [Clostridia bacterium]|nr:hypothetical protein [Clostridia bacterium]
MSLFNSPKDRPRGPRSPVALLIIILAIGAGIIAYTNGDPRRTLQLEAPYAPGEASRFESRIEGRPFASWELRVEADGEGAALVSDKQGGDFHEQATVFVAPDYLTPVRTEFIRDSSEGRAAYTALFHENEVAITASLPSGVQDKMIAPPAQPCFDLEQAPMLIRAIPFRRGYRATFNTVISRLGITGTLTVHVVKKETISVPAGRYTAWAVELKGTGVTVWVGVDPPHPIVKYVDRKANAVSELTQFIPGSHNSGI